MFNRFACIWPKSYQRGSLGKSHQNGDYLKQAMQKSCLPAGFEPAVFEPVIQRLEASALVAFRPEARQTIKHEYYCLLLLYAKMLKETEIKQTIGFVVILFIIGGVPILASTSYLFDYAYNFWPVN